MRQRQKGACQDEGEERAGCFDQEILIVLSIFNLINKNYSITYLFRKDNPQKRNKTNQTQHTLTTYLVLQPERPKPQQQLGKNSSNCKFLSHQKRRNLSALIYHHFKPLSIKRKTKLLDYINKNKQKCMRPFCPNNSDEVFIEENRQEDINRMRKLLVSGSSVEIQKHFYGEAKLRNSQMHRVVDSQINKHLAALTHRNKSALITLLKKVEQGSLNSHEIKILHQQKTSFSVNQQECQIQRYLSFMDDVYVGSPAGGK